MKSPRPCNEADLWKKRLGKLGEGLVAEGLREKGWEIEVSNWRNGKKGEIDIIGRDPQGIQVFLEVKTRCLSRAEAGFQTAGFDAITWKKKQKIVTSARCYLAERDLLKTQYRFDVVVVTFICDPAKMDLEGLPEPIVTHVEQAIGGF
ncbi:MAG: hypothetical protein C0469_14415 [Cyanobacteria bacterium DS2.3.42]|nr:hypothetical protein [Cyanobacteria bacterium DS2.3.42]